MADPRWSIYNATDGSFLVPEGKVTLLLQVYKVSVFHGTWLGLSIAVLIAFLLLSTARNRRGVIFYILAFSFLMLITSSTISISWVGRRQKLFFSKSLEEQDIFLDAQRECHMIRPARLCEDEDEEDSELTSTSFLRYVDATRQ
jgi:hypothetical protein